MAMFDEPREPEYNSRFETINPEISGINEDKKIYSIKKSFDLIG